MNTHPFSVGSACGHGSELGVGRRQFLRGLGTALALPLLESAAPRALWAAQASQASITPKPPVRMAFLFVPNGKIMPDWTPAAEGADYKLTPTLEPLAELRDQFQLISGLAHDKGRALGDGPGDHARNAATFLTGVHPVKTAGKGVRVGISVDQVAAEQIGAATKFPSLELACDAGRNAGSCDSGYSCAYSHNISWRSPTTPATKEVNPRLVFDRLFGDGTTQAQAQSRAQRDAQQRSILDWVQDDARRMRSRLAGADQLKLDEYLDSVREIEQRIDRQDAEAEFVGELRRPQGVPAEFGEHARLMGDLMVMAFQADLTRVCSFMLGSAGSGRSYEELGVREGHHQLSHHGNDEEKIRKIAKIDRFHVEQLAYVLRRMKSIPEGDGTLLDHSMLVYGSGLADGNRHTHHDLPIILAGGGGGAFQTGRHIRYPKDTPLMNLYRSMLENAGIEVEDLGDSTGALKGLGRA